MSNSKFNDLKNDLQTVELENRLEMVHIPGGSGEAESYRCKVEITIGEPEDAA